MNRIETFRKYIYCTVALFFAAVTISCSKKINAANLQLYTNSSTAMDTVANPPLIPDTSIILPSVNDTSIKSYLALGDSYTIGASVSEAERFPNQVVQLLKDEGIKIEDFKIIATTGWTTGNLISALNSNPPGENYSVVSLLIGVNNQYRGQSIDEYKTEFTILLNLSIQYAGNNKNNVFVLSIPDYSVTPFGSQLDKEKIASDIDSFNSINKTISGQFGVHYVDITDISREAESDPSLIAGDGLHPSGEQYKRWAELLAPLMKKSL